MVATVQVDEKLLAEAMQATGVQSKRAMVEAALNEIVREQRARKALKELRGIGWDGDLDEMRRNWWKGDASL